MIDFDKVPQKCVDALTRLDEDRECSSSSRVDRYLMAYTVLDAIGYFDNSKGSNPVNPEERMRVIAREELSKVLNAAANRVRLPAETEAATMDEALVKLINYVSGVQSVKIFSENVQRSRNIY